MLHKGEKEAEEEKVRKSSKESRNQEKSRVGEGSSPSQEQDKEVT